MHLLVSIVIVLTIAEKHHVNITVVFLFYVVVSGATSTPQMDAMKESYLQLNKWKNVNNIVELVKEIDCLQLYPLVDKEKDEFDGNSGAILRCETCFFLYKDKAVKLTPA